MDWQWVDFLGDFRLLCQIVLRRRRQRAVRADGRRERCGAASQRAQRRGGHAGLRCERDRSRSCSCSDSSSSCYRCTCWNRYWCAISTWYSTKCWCGLRFLYFFRIHHLQHFNQPMFPHHFSNILITIPLNRNQNLSKYVFCRLNENQKLNNPAQNFHRSEFLGTK